MFPSYWEHILPVICVPRVAEPISIVICVSWVGEHISPGICVPWAEERISLVICVSRVGERISPEICAPQVGAQISLVIRVSRVGEHMSLVIWVSRVGERISLGIRVSKVGEHMSLVIYVSSVGERIPLAIWVKTRSSKSRKIGIFPKSLVHGFDKNWQFFRFYIIFRKNRPGKCVSRYSRKKKKVCVDYKNKKFKKSKNWVFPKVNSFGEK